MTDAEKIYQLREALLLVCRGGTLENAERIKIVLAATAPEPEKPWWESCLWGELSDDVDEKRFLTAAPLMAKVLLKLLRPADYGIVDICDDARAALEAAGVEVPEVGK